MELKKISLVLLTVLITLTTAYTLNYGAKSYTTLNLFSIGIVLVVIGINFIKFKLWGVIYDKYQLNESYPLVAMFFPLLYMSAIYSGVSEFSISKTIGVCLIVLGILVMNKKEKNDI